MGVISYLRGLIGGGPRSQSFDLTGMTPSQIEEFLRLGGSMSSTSGALINETTAKVCQIRSIVPTPDNREIEVMVEEGTAT